MLVTSCIICNDFSYTIGITRSLHDVFFLLLYCSDMFPTQFLDIFKQLASLSTYTAHVIHLHVAFVEGEIRCLTFRCKHWLRAFWEGGGQGGNLDLRRHKWQQNEESCIMQRAVIFTIQRNLGWSDRANVDGTCSMFGSQEKCIQRCGRNARRNEPAWNAWAQLCG